MRWLNRAIGLVLCVAMASCNAKEDEAVTTIVAPYITNAEYVLGEIQNNGGTAIVLQLNPQLSNLCTHMMVEISALSENGEWTASNILYPGKDKRDAMGEVLIKNQPHFAAITTPGKHAVTALGCQTHGQGMKGVRGLLAFFTTEPGKLNYLGEITYQYVSGGRANAIIADRKVDAVELISKWHPALLEHLHISLATLPAPVLVTPPPPESIDSMETVKALKRFRLLQISGPQKQLRKEMDATDDKKEYRRLMTEWSFLEEERSWLILNKTDDVSTIRAKIKKRRRMITELKSLAKKLGKAPEYYIRLEPNASASRSRIADQYNELIDQLRKQYKY